MTFVSIVVPVYHNEGSLSLLLERLSQVAAGETDCAFEFVFVDDGSRDGSFRVLTELAARDDRVIVIKLSRNFGSNIALAAGLEHARGDCVGMIAADLQDPPELFTEMLARWRNGKSVVMAARKKRADPFFTRLPAAIFNRAFRKFVFNDFPPDGYDFVLIDRKVVDVVVTCAEKNSYLFGLIMWAGFDRDVIFYDRVERAHGVSMWTLSKKMKYFIDAFTSFSYLPLRLTSSMGILLAFVGLVYGVIVVLSRVIGNVPVEGWTSIMIVLLIASGTQLIILGMIGEYIWRALEQTRSRPLFIVDRVITKRVQSQTLNTIGISGDTVPYTQTVYK